MASNKPFVFKPRYAHNRIDPRIKKMADLITQHLQYVRLASTSIFELKERSQLARVGEIAKINLILNAYFLAMKEDTLLRGRVEKLWKACREWERAERNILCSMRDKE